MLPLILLFTLVALTPLASGYFQTVTTAEPLTVTRSVVSLDNFMFYRNAVQTFTEQNQAYTGTVPDAALTGLPPGYQKSGPWTNQITATQVVVYGNSNVGRLGASTLPNNSVSYGANYQVGYAKNGNWETTSAGVITAAPSYVPEGAILAIINKQ